MLKTMDLRTRMALSITALVIALVAGMSWFAERSQRQALDRIAANTSTLAVSAAGQQATALESALKTQIQASQDALQTKGASLAGLVANLAPAALLTFDTAALESLCRQAGADRDVRECRVLDGKFKLVAIYRKPGAGPGESVDVKADVMQDGKKVGRVVLSVSMAGVKKQESGMKSDYAALHQAMSQSYGAIEGGVQEQSRSQTREALMLAVWIGLGAILLSLGCALGISGSVVRPLRRTVAVLERVAEGDLTPRLDEAGARDEIGQIARAFNQTLARMGLTVQEIKKGAERVASASRDLSASSGEMTAGSRQASDKAHSVASAAEQLSVNSVSMVAGMQQTTANLATVAGATSQMTSTIGEIAGNSERARRITEGATRTTAGITERMNALGEAVKEIGKVTEAITEISSQTNLLALNATIEAARAGAAGKGFAVVASEVKALALQASAATQDIRNRIAVVQSAATGGIAEIQKVAIVFSEMNEIVSSIAAAIEEQSVTARHIARSIEDASGGVGDTNSRVFQSSQATREIAQGIAGVDEAAGNMTEGSEKVLASARSLLKVAGELEATVALFRV